MGRRAAARPAAASARRGWYRNTGKGPWDATVGCMELAASSSGRPASRTCRSRLTPTAARAAAASTCTNIPARSGGTTKTLAGCDSRSGRGLRVRRPAPTCGPSCCSPPAPRRCQHKSTTGAGMLYLPHAGAAVGGVPDGGEHLQRRAAWGASTSPCRSRSSRTSDDITGVMRRRAAAGRTSVQLAYGAPRASSEVVNQVRLNASIRCSPARSRPRHATLPPTTSAPVGRILRNGGRSRAPQRDAPARSIEFIAQRFIDNSDAYADVQRTAINTMNRRPPCCRSVPPACRSTSKPCGASPSAPRPARCCRPPARWARASAACCGTPSAPCRSGAATTPPTTPPTSRRR